jgi:hypothetical protein
MSAHTVSAGRMLPGRTRLTTPRSHASQWEYANADPTPSHSRKRLASLLPIPSCEGASRTSHADSAQGLCGKPLESLIGEGTTDSRKPPGS